MLVLFELAQNLGEALNTTHVGDIVVRHSRRVVPWTLLMLYLHDQNSTELVSTYASGEHSGVFSGLKDPSRAATEWLGRSE